MKQMSSLFLAVIILFSSCKKNDDNNTHGGITGTFSSNEVTMYGGKAKTWVMLTNGIPQQLAISVNNAAMNSLPTDGDETETELSLPTQASGTVLNHVVIDWNPHGHPPIGVYSFPHFDFHFYMMSKEARMNIPAYEDDSTGFLKYPAPQYLPANYIAIPGGEAQMGTHWVDVTSPEMNGAPFTQTFIYGSYNGNVTFYEPMITKAFLDTTTAFERTIPQPSITPEGGYYPTKLNVSKHDGVTEIILTGFIKKLKM